MASFQRTARQNFTPLLTPFTGNSVDLEALKAAVDRQIAARMDGIVVCDAVGEGHSLTQAERDAILRTCVSRGHSRLTVIAAAGTCCTKTTIEQCRRAVELGADALLVTIPYYSKPTLAGVVRHFAQVASSVTKPIIVDDDPGRTARDYGMTLLEELAELDMIAGICHGPDRFAYFATLSRAARKRFLHFSRDDNTLRQFVAIGGTGIFSPLANIIPSVVKLRMSVAESCMFPTELGDSLIWDAVAALRRDDVAALKEASSFIHQTSPDVRLPLLSAEPETTIRIRRAFAPFARSENSERAAAA